MLGKLRATYPHHIVSGRWKKRLQSLGVDRIDDDARSVRQIGEAPHIFEHLRVVAIAAEEPEAVRDEDRHFAPRQLAQSAHHKIQRAQRADGEDSLLEIFKAIFSLPRGFTLFF